MLVFVSDIHLTDGSSGTTINPKAFDVFTHHLAYLAEKAGAEEVDVILLGDILDVIRSRAWLDTCIRPWSEETEVHGEHQGLQHYTEQIVSAICTSPQNIAASRSLGEFKKKMASNGTDVRYHYIVGNHDWLLNRYPQTRKAAGQFLHLASVSTGGKQPYPDHGYWPKYKVFARHGDLHDPFNHEGNRDASSLGDAIVINLLNRFPEAVASRLGGNTCPALVAKLREIDNVRPLLDVPEWVNGVCEEHPRHGQEVKEVWNDLVDDFLEDPFVRSRNKAWRLDMVDALEIALFLSKTMSVGRIAKALRGEALRDMIQPSDYIDHAAGEDMVRARKAEFVVYGHTHQHEIRPLDAVPVTTGRVLNQTYINTGTWRRMHLRAEMDPTHREFMNWDVMTFVAFYLPAEREDRRFEVWNGALG